MGLAGESVCACLTMMMMSFRTRASVRLGRVAARSVHIEARIASLGYTLPDLPQPAGSYKLGVKQDGWVFLAGHLPFKEDMKSVHVGRVGEEFTAEEGAKLAEIVGLELVASLKRVVGDLDKVKRITKVNGFIACPQTFTALPTVLNGASNLLGEIFEDRGVHARSALGVTSLPCAQRHTHRTLIAVVYCTRELSRSLLDDSMHSIACVRVCACVHSLGVPVEIDLIAQVED